MTETTDEKTQRLRKKYAFSSAGDRIHRTEQYLAEFDAWLAEVRAAAWDEGNAAGWNDGARANTAGLDAETPNPYRPNLEEADQ